MLVILCMLIPTTVYASWPAPAGKNMLNPAQFLYDSSGRLETLDPIPVSAGQTYTLTVPEIGWIDTMSIHIAGVGGSVYIDDTIGVYDQCIQALSSTICTFSVSAQETGINILFEGGFLAQWYSHYGMHSFQLEVGDESTAYEAFIADSASEPEFQGSHSIEHNYKVNQTLQTIINQHITAYDDIDGDLTDQIFIIDDDYSGHETTVGSYSVLLGVSDYSGNEAYFELIVHIIDDIPPVIQGPSTILIEQAVAPNIHTLITNYYTFNDDYDGVITEYDILHNTYPNSDVTAGVYQTTIRIEDNAGNQTERQFSIEVTQSSTTSITGPERFNLYMSENPSNNSILSLFQAIDSVTESSLPITIKSSSVPNGFNRVGSFSVTLSTKDSLNKTITKDVVVTLIDDIPPVFMFDDVLVVELGSTINETDIFNLLRANYLKKGIDIHTMEVLEDQYSDHQYQVGIYPYKVRLLSDTDTIHHQLRIQVAEPLDIVENNPSYHIIIMASSLIVVMGGLLIKKRFF